MPSGAKKRKAARKRKENHSVSTHSHDAVEDADVKQQDGKDGDVGELSSPTSHDHHSHQSLSTEGEEEENEKGKKTSDPLSEEALRIQDSEEPSTVVQNDFVVPVDREYEIEDKSSKTDDGSSSQSSSGSNSSRSSSDDESHCIKNGEAAIDIAPVVNPGNGSESLSGVLDGNIGSAEIGDGVDSVVVNSPVEELKNTSSLGEKVETGTSSPSDRSLASYMVEPVDSEEKRQSFIEDKVGISTVFMDVPLKRKEMSIENIVSLDPSESVTKESDDRVANNTGVVLEKDSRVTELLLVPAPHPGQATSWKSCCGLFEVFTGSGR